MVQKIKAFCLVAFAIFIFLSLISYHPDDTSFRSFPSNSPVKNATGVVGAHISEGLIFSLGWASYLVCILALVWAVARLIEKKPPKLYMKSLSTIILLLSVAVLLALFVGPGEEELIIQRGGLIGSVVSAFLFRYFGGAGSLIIALSLAILASFVATEFLLIPIFKWLTRKSVELIRSIKELPKHLFSKTKEAPSRNQGLKFTFKKEKPAVIIKEPKAQEQTSQFLKSAPKIIEPVPVKKAAISAISSPKVSYADYKLPSLDLLNSPPAGQARQTDGDLEAASEILQSTLRDFGVEVRVTDVSPGPVLTMYELEPAPGVQVNRITGLSDDIALAMKVPSVRIVAPIPGKSRVGIEVPNSKSSTVYLREILESADFQNAKSKLTLAIGKDISGQPIVTDLADMPHLLIAGTTGAGKTVCVNSIITSILYNASPDDVKFVMVDPKMVELNMFNGLPHLLSPVLTDHKKVSLALDWLTKEMDNRYKVLVKVGARNIDAYNEKIRNLVDEPLEKMPYIIVIIDELADLMVVAPQDVENAITRLAQLSRAVGIHLILATQRPSVDVITGVIKANFPARISFRVASKVDSRTVLDANGADKLLGKGDLLFLKPGQHKPVRIQGSLIFDNELERVIKFIKDQRGPVYNQELLDVQEKKGAIGKKFDRDEVYDEAVKVIMQSKQASVSMLQRRLGLGYTRAARLIDMMEEEGIVGPYRGSKPREILVERANFDQKQEQREQSEEQDIEKRFK